MYTLPLLTAGTDTGNPFFMILIWVGMFGLMWFFLIRPQRKQQRETQMLQNSIEIGDSVLLTSGFYGKVVDAVNNVLIVELGTNKSVRVPVNRTAVVSKTEPDLSIAKDSED